MPSLFEALLVHFYNFVNIMKNFLMIQLDDLATKEENTNESQPRGEDDQATALSQQQQQVPQLEIDKDRRSSSPNSNSIAMMQVICYMITGILALISARLENETAIIIFKKLLQICFKFNRHIIPLIWIATLEPAKSRAVNRIKGVMVKMGVKSDEN